eukprot:TRINITY_DN2792_c0_g1_i6.p1 TRINITY_DN2792_c0_g1~~TRINITY_DN2792_c0_g1_i6.p1  ORF type:complete len:652 (-),score=217.87 TRINITY_DN2792_c0_g1_i6:55-2010(-)
MVQQVINDVWNLHANTKPIIRKKAYAALIRIFTKQPELISQYIEKICNRIGNENNNMVLSLTVTMFYEIIKKAPTLYPIMIKPIYELFNKTKNNWLLIKMIKLLDKIMALEPRLQKKLIEPYGVLLSQSGSKSIQYELINTILRHFKDVPNLYNQACECLKSIIKMPDPNLTHLGLGLLRQLLGKHPAQFSDYLEYLKEAFTKNGSVIKQGILKIYEEFVNPGTFETIANDLTDLLESTKDHNLVEKIIESLIVIFKKNHYENIQDFEWLMLEIIPKLTKKTISRKNAQALTDLLLDLTMRVPELKELSVKFALSIMFYFDQENRESRYQNQVFISDNSSTKRSETAQDVIYRGVLHLIGENIQTLKMPVEYFTILDLLKRENMSFLISKNIMFLEATLFKMAIAFAKLIVSSDSIKSDNGGSGDIEQIRINTFFSFIQQYLEIHNKMLQASIDGVDAAGGLYFFNIILGALGIKSFSETLQSEDLGLSKDTLVRLSNLSVFYQEDFLPVHHDAQKFVKTPEGLDLDQEIEITVEEQKLLEDFLSSYEQQDGKKKKKKDATLVKEEDQVVHKDSEDIRTQATSPGGDENHAEKHDQLEETKENSNTNAEETAPKQKKVYNVIKRDILPEGAESLVQTTEVAPAENAGMKKQ